MGRGSRYVSAAVCLALLSPACSRRPALPPLPTIAAEQFLSAVREQVDKAYEAVRAKPDDAAANGQLGRVLHAHDELESAAVLYERARLIAPKRFDWTYLLAVVRAAQGRHDEAAAGFRESLRLTRDYLPARLKLAESLYAAGKLDASAAEFEAILRDHSNFAPAHYGLGRVRTSRGDSAAAAESYRRATELFPAYGTAHYALALAYRRLGEPERAEEHLARYEQHKDDVPPVDDSAMLEVRRLASGAVNYIRQAQQAERAGKLDEAVALHAKALEADSKMVQAHVNLITLYGRLGRTEKAEEHFREAQRLNPNQADAFYNYGVLLFGLKRYREAGEAFRRAIEINPSYAEAHNNLAFLLEQQGRLNEAIEHYRKAVEHKPDYRLAHFHLGRVLVNRKRYSEGIEHLQQTLMPEDESTPGFLYALASAYARSGNREQALPLARRAREQAAARGQTQLLAAIERDLRQLEK